ncbi:CLUMA_CG007991, isoform A, partial [Clunio marinus]
INDVFFSYLQFYDLILRDGPANATLQYRAVTVFAPTNQAFQRYPDLKIHVLYHMTNTPNKMEHLKPSMLTEMDGNPPIYITKRRTKQGEEIYVNNAMILKSRSNVDLKNKNGKRQILHVIDDVLNPLSTGNRSSNEIYNPDALTFLTNANTFDIGSHRVRSFYQRVVIEKKESLFAADGFHTFFIPVEEGFKPSPRPDMIDKKVIDGHVIPNHVVFTAPAHLEHQYETEAFEDNLKVTAIFFTANDGKQTKMYVKSNTVVGDSKHTTGVVMAEIVLANIPVKNGVVHLIHRPLMVVDTTVAKFLEEKEDGPLFKFYEVIMDVGGEFMTTINSMRDVTLFAPSNEAWNRPEVRNIIGNKQKMREILNLHLVNERLNSDKIRANNNNQIAQIPTNVDKKFLYFNVVNRDDNNKTITVEGGGVNATIIQSDIAATNGFVHIIDHVLGVPYMSVLEKLQTDPMLNNTLWLGSRNEFNAQLNGTTAFYTFFVPRDMAWRNLENEYPSVYTKLFLPHFSYHARLILEHHLIVADKRWTMAELRDKSMKQNSELLLDTVRGHLRVKINEHDRRYSITWNNKKINVFRSDVICTNGIIHVIDRPFIEEGDIRVTYNTATALQAVLLPTLIMLILTKLFN